MTDKPTCEATHLGPLEDASLYLGDSNFVINSFEHPLGTLAVAIAACDGKPNGNEDSAGIVPVANDCLVFMVADGVGGSATPRKASNTVVQTLRESLREIEDEDTRVRTAILDGIETSNKQLLNMSTGTATTLIVADIRDQQVRTFHVGDSVAWLVGQRGVIKLQTTPHSPVGFGIEAGLINETEALKHKDLHIISNVIGSSDMRVEIGSKTPMAPLDTLLIASDGLFDNVLPDEIVEIIRTGPVGEGAAQLCKLALERMAGKEPDKPSKPDDFSAVLFRPNG
ncbi:MAG: serine/threonine-protein phosphatase [Gammaproteobacteria bacterium]|nr:serine/threonine-protein phosphatase [Gammaproteobacteria bacterium]MCP4089478.1 serine/threonine-protein phosphatase [Gammaproteobacteria bacterium]MCP4276184.1 serine/threonine-protein phosphatase [Gammaproteobacteria bacterium]MCP4832881.1 serine/threonine-protein phosphatase [Gammaproteobacteria bacterium]MCP4930006.1 serine/threonine-protein phosphatase [Gammaproteobacteria bacterium]